MLALPLLVLAAGSIVYCLLTVLAALRYRAVQLPPVENPLPLSVLKPLAGVDDGLEENLRSFFELDYPAFEILMAVRSPLDEAIPLVEQLQMSYPRVRSRLVVTGEPPYSNAKVYSLHRMLALARNDVVVMADSDVRVAPDLLWTIAAEFQDGRNATATSGVICLAGAYRIQFESKYKVGPLGDRNICNLFQHLEVRRAWSKR